MLVQCLNEMYFEYSTVSLIFAWNHFWNPRRFPTRVSVGLGIYQWQTYGTHFCRWKVCVHFLWQRKIWFQPFFEVAPKNVEKESIHGVLFKAISIFFWRKTIALTIGALCHWGMVIIFTNANLPTFFFSHNANYLWTLMSSGRCFKELKWKEMQKLDWFSLDFWCSIFQPGIQYIYCCS